MSPGYSSAMLKPKHPFSNVGGSYQTHSNLQAHPQEYVVGVPPINTGTVASTSTGMAVPQPPSSPQPPPIQANIPPPPPPPCAPSLPTHINSLEKGNLPGIKATGSGDRGGLLQSIQAGTKLKKVTESRAPIPKVESNSMRGALARALDNRAKVLGDEDSDDDDEWDDDDDDDWSD
ncbi:neural Wiskott-Aldrich syndrome protein-like [Xenia sp. Carnegie-2017]|uniref:neural Wiskott-Aldrich syndrome protein-like n=1 Tax=Xenia sp. Carnegie-2017 TaxID=2897299 RepID=UPI001F03BE5F|nr:neural Wiskott-Aldrich syndrome protein-like [Xenia sp. Carnegie-2017]